MPVILQGPKGEIQVLALFDEGSAVTLVDRAMAGKLGLKSVSSTISLNGLNNTPLEVKILGVADCSVSGLSSKNFHLLRGVYVIGNLKLPIQQLTSEVINSFKHLQDLDIAAYPSEAPKILIGQDNCKLIVSRELKIALLFCIKSVFF